MRQEMTGFWDAVSWTICKQSAPRSRQITTPTPHHSIFTGRMLFLTPNQQSTEGRLSTLPIISFIIHICFVRPWLLIAEVAEPAVKWNWPDAESEHTSVLEMCSHRRHQRQHFVPVAVRQNEHVQRVTWLTAGAQQLTRPQQPAQVGITQRSLARLKTCTCSWWRFYNLQPSACPTNSCFAAHNGKIRNVPISHECSFVRDTFQSESNSNNGQLNRKKWLYIYFISILFTSKYTTVILTFTLSFWQSGICQVIPQWIPQ